MAAACGFTITAALTEKGKVCAWDWDDGCNGMHMHAETLIHPLLHTNPVHM